MQNQKPVPGATFPIMEVSQIGGGKLQIGVPADNFDWQLVVVYRGKHCPMCTSYLTELNETLKSFNDIGVDVIAVSADPEQKATEHTAPLNLNYKVGYDLSVTQMQNLGLFVSNPHSIQENDRPFAEPGIFVINESGLLQVVDISNTPFTRPSISTLAGGLGFVRNPDNNYPIRGTYTQAA